MENKGVDVWQHCWTLGMFTEQQERAELRSHGHRQHLAALVSTVVGQGHSNASSCPTLPVVTGITGMSFPSATLLQAQLKLCLLLLAQI